MEETGELQLGMSEGIRRLSISREHRELVPALAAQARRSISLYTRDLDPVVYDSAEFEEALSAFARRNKFTSVRILVQDPTRAVKEGHRILRLAQRLSSKLQLRVPGEDDRSFNEAFLVIDDVTLLRRPVADLYAGEARFDDPFEARRLLKYFDNVWERAEPDPQLRRLML